jgi:hypothetical protein
VRRAFPALSLVASLTACSALAGCGGGAAPALRESDARHLIALAHGVEAAGTPCARQRAIARLRTSASDLIDAGRVPAALQETLSSGVNALVADEPTCLPAVAAPAATTPAPVAPAPRRHPHPHPGPPPGHGHDHGPGHGPRHGHRGRG